MKKRTTTTLLTLLLATALTANAQLHRGVWFWGSTTLADGSPSPYGSIDVVGNDTAEDETLAFFTTNGVKRVYGSYQNRPDSEPDVIATWNAKLDEVSISSQLLIDGTDVNDPAWITTLLNNITIRLIDFNNSLGADTPSKFDALHLDLEPQGLAIWSDPFVKRALLDDLLQAYIDVRAHLDSAGFTTMPIYVDIPFFYDKMWDGSEGVGWASTADRDSWYASVSAVVDGISIMTFSKDNFASIDTATAYERSGAMLGKARVAIQPKVGPGQLWPHITYYNGVMNQLETNYGPTGATDIENYGFWRHAKTYLVATISGVHTVSLVSDDDDDDGGVIIIGGIPGYIYTIKSSTDLNDWKPLQELSTMQDNRPRTMRVPVKTNAPRRFFKVERSDPPQPR